MLNKLLIIYKKAQFDPGFIGIFINPFYFIRKGLITGIKKQSCHLKGNLLDFGCGSKPYKNFFSVEKYIGVDVLDKGHPHENENVDVYYDGNFLPFNNEHFDSIFSSEVFEHVFDLEKTISELNRVLKKNGLALFTVPFVWDEHEIPYDFGRYSSFGIRYLLEKKGFEIISLEKSAKFLEVVFQFWNLYLFHKLYTRNKYINIVINILFISPFTVLGIMVSSLLPNIKSLYHNNIILTRKAS